MAIKQQHKYVPPNLDTPSSVATTAWNSVVQSQLDKLGNDSLAEFYAVVATLRSTEASLSMSK